MDCVSGGRTAVPFTSAKHRLMKRCRCPSGTLLALSAVHLFWHRCSCPPLMSEGL